MDFSFLSGGIMLAAMAAVWLILFTPGARSKAEEREHEFNARRAAKAATSAAARIARSIEAQAQIEAESKAVQSERDWSATRVPAPLYRSEIGTLETPKLADVIDFASEEFDSLRVASQKNEENNAATRINLDEIMRRRRANGS